MWKEEVDDDYAVGYEIEVEEVEEKGVQKQSINQIKWKGKIAEVSKER